MNTLKEQWQRDHWLTPVFTKAETRRGERFVTALNVVLWIAAIASFWWVIGCAPNARYASLVTIVMRDGQVERVTAGADVPTTQPADAEPNHMPLPWE